MSCTKWTMHRAGPWSAAVCGLLLVAACASDGRRAVAPGEQATTGAADGAGTGAEGGTTGATPENPLGPPPTLDCDVEGQVVDCYDGAPQEIGIGACVAGQRTCTDGRWSVCVGQVVAVPEYCDTRDNDCDGEVDEGVLSACGDCNPNCGRSQSGSGTTDPFVVGEQSSTNIVTTADGWVTLSEETIDLNVIWVANSQESTVSKLDTVTGYEVGRYRVCGDPSRTAVGKFGDGWIACRSDSARVAYIWNFDGDCEDRNQNGVIDTSRDVNGDHVIDPADPAELLPEGEDECVKWTAQAAGTPANPAVAVKTRALGVTADETAWVGVWETSQLVLMEKEQGQILQVVSLPAQPYGLALDDSGAVWISGRVQGLLVRVDPVTLQVSELTPGSGYSPYGIAVDAAGRVWTAQLASGDDAIYAYEPNLDKWTKIPVQPRARGLVATPQGKVFVATDQSHLVTVIDQNTKTVLTEVALGPERFPLGMAVDSQGFVWAVNQQAGTVHKLNGTTHEIVDEYPVGKGPYTYSDMTGSAFFDAVQPGWYRHRFEAEKTAGVTGLAAMANAVWKSLTIEFVAPPGAFIEFRARAAATEEALEEELWTPLVGPFPEETFPVDLTQIISKTGRFLEVEVRLTASEDKAKPLLKGFDVEFEAAP